LITPLYVVWRVVVGPVGTAPSFEVFNGFLTLVLSTTASALAAVQVYWLAGWLGATRRGQLWAVGLFAFGTENFAFGTMLFKENLAGVAVISSVRAALQPGTARSRALSGFLASAASATALSATLFPLLPLFLIIRREGIRRAVAFCLGSAPILLALCAYNLWTFGSPWHPGHLSLTAVPQPYPTMPKASVLIDILLGPQSGLFLYAPFLFLSVLGILRGRRSRACAEGAMTVAFLLILWIEAAAWLSQFKEPVGLGNQLGSRYLFPAVPLLAAFAGRPIESLNRSARMVVGFPSIFFSYLGAQAGYIPDPNEFSYAVKTCVSGTGMGVVFKEGLPRWLGFDTLHTVVSRPDVSAWDLVRMLPTPRGLALIRNQAALLAVNLAVLAGIGWIISRLWRTVALPTAPPSPSLDGQAAADHHRS